MARVSISNVDEFVSTQCTGQMTVGIDVHSKSYSVTVIDRNGALKSWTTTADPERLLNQLKDWDVPINCVAYEAGPTGFGLARLLQESGIKVIVAAPSRIPRPVTPGSKTDRLDCVALAKLAQKGMLSPIAIPSREQDAIRALGRRRNQISKQVRRIKQWIKSFLLLHQIKQPAGLAYWSSVSLDRLRRIKLDKALHYTLDGHIDDLEHYLAQRQVVDLQLKELLDERESDRMAVECMQSVPGVGFVTASQFRLEIFEPGRFHSKEQLTSLVGLAPVVRQTGHQKGRAKIGRASKKELRSLLVEAAWRLRAKEPWARQFYDRILSRTGVPQKAIVALARKLCIILWRICLEMRPYRTVDAN